MGAFGGPDIITDGLDYLIDAGSTRSYIGTGTTVNSLAGSATSTMYNGVGFQSGVAYGTWRFDGVNDYISTTSVLVSSPTSLTIGGWFKRNGNNGSYATVLHHGANNSIGSSSFFFGMVSGSNLIVGTIGANTGVVGGWSAGQTDVVAAVDVWYNVISTWDGSQVKTYVDGVLKRTYNLSFYTNNTTPTRVGASADGGGYLVNGDIAHVFVAENKHYSAEEVLQNYNAQKNRFI
jgi:hypothetical protein